MPISVMFSDDGGVRITGTGLLVGAELRNVNDQMYATDERIAAIKYQLVDFTHIEGVHISNDDVRLIAEQDRRAAKINPTMAVALVIKEELLYGLARMWQAYTEDMLANSQVFETMAEARAWLGLDPEPA